MFVDFFYDLREAGVPVNPTVFLRLQKALFIGLVENLDDFYVVARSVMVKSEKYFDLYDRVFAKYFYNIEMKDSFDEELEATMRLLIEDWLKDPEQLAELLDIDPQSILNLSIEELVEYYMQKLKEQTEAHHGGNRWIGTRGTSPLGHSGQNPGGIRIGGRSGARSAVKVAMERRYRDYNLNSRLTTSQVGEALRRLKHLKPAGPRDVVNIDKTITETVKNAGEIEIVFDRALRDKLKIILMIDNGGWSMDPYVEVVQTLFNYAKSQFKQLKIFYFHNTIYDKVWKDPTRRYKPIEIVDFARYDPETRLIIVGDASMAPSELEHQQGSVYLYERQAMPSIGRLKFLEKTFRHSAWLNPMVEYSPSFKRGPYTVPKIASIFSMFALSLEGLERTVTHLMRKN